MVEQQAHIAEVINTPLMRHDDCQRAPIPNSQHESGTSKKEAEIFADIGTALSELECSTLSVGIPLLFPSKSVRQSQVIIDSTLGEYVKQRFVTVPTPTLDLYLCQLEEQGNPLTSLHIATRSLMERFGYVAPLTFGLVVGFWSLAHTYLSTTIVALLIGCLVTIICAELACMVTSELYRRTTFLTVLRKELQRRRGYDDPNNAHLSVFPVET